MPQNTPVALLCLLAWEILQHQCKVCSNNFRDVQSEDKDYLHYVKSPLYHPPPPPLPPSLRQLATIFFCVLQNLNHDSR